MANNINAHCTICGQGYHVCVSCQESKLSPWRSIVDNIDHYKIYMVIRDYTNKYITKIEAKEQLNKCDLTGLENFVLEIRLKIEEIMREDIVESLEIPEVIKEVQPIIKKTRAKKVAKDELV